jgi:hypothetical protein
MGAPLRDLGSHREEDDMAAEKYGTQRKMPGLIAVRAFDGGWAVVSANSRQPLTENEAKKIIAAHFTMDELLRSTI